MKPILERWQLAYYTTVKSFTYRKDSIKLYNFRVPVFKGIAFPWNDTHPLKMTAGQVYECIKFHFLHSEC